MWPSDSTWNGTSSINPPGFESHSRILDSQGPGLDPLQHPGAQGTIPGRIRRA